MKNFSKYYSVRKSGDVLKVKLESDGAIVFKGSAPVNDSEKVAALIKVLRSKGLSLPKKESSWW